MRQAGHILGLCHQYLKTYSKPGVSLIDLDQQIYQLIKHHKAIPAFLNYHNFPNSICVSVNDVLIHGIPSDYRLKEGDIVSYDVGVNYENYFSDAAFTMGIGKISAADENLINVTADSLQVAIDLVRNGVSLNIIGEAIYDVISKAGFYVPDDYCGHGIGKNLHESPFVLNYPVNYQLPKLRTNMVIAIEPMVLQGSKKVNTLDDGWSVASASGKNCAHFEHTIWVKENDCEVLSVINHD